jgi:hypothetical protein
MIHYQLHCGQSHEFDGWFAGSEAFEDQQKRGLISCPFCSDTKIQRALMAPALGRKSNRMPEPLDPSLKTEVREETPLQTPPALAMQGGEASTQLAELVQKMRHEIEMHCDYVGNDFAEEARKIHYGEIDARGIYGEATIDEAQELVDEGIEVAALPWAPRTNS